MVTYPEQSIDRNSELLGRLRDLCVQVEKAARGPASAPVKKAKQQAGGSRTRMTGAEEDERLIQEASEESKGGRLWLSVQPSCIKGGAMRSYQLEGLNWLISLHEKNLNGILADEMGLGKTLQTVSLLGFLKTHLSMHGPFLVIAPKSTLSNWAREFERWCPCMRVVRLHGDQEERTRVVSESLSSEDKFDVLLTTYEIVVIEKVALRRFVWNYIVVDEAHRIKNEKSVLSQVVRCIPSRRRLLITGTPLQNNLHELWALLNFLMPDLFGDSEIFDSLFASGAHSDEVVSLLHAVLKPLILRRLKADVEKALPPKKETKLYVPLTALQRKVYAGILAKDASILNAMSKNERGRLVNVLIQLRKVCNHPYLFDGVEPGPPYIEGPHLWECGGKMHLLHKLLMRLRAEGHRVLVFSQMTRMMDILEDYCRYMQLEYCRLDGQTSTEMRDTQIDEYNRPGSSKFVFLLSTRAGGLGVNLQTADTVILYDSDWNPQVDLQAQDRAHRVGQTKQVRVFRFISEKTVEEKIVERAEKKLYLDAMVIQQGRLVESGSKLGSSEMLQMVRFGADEVFKAQTGTVSDLDIDAILLDGAQRTEELQRRIMSNMQHTLKNFVFDGSAPGESSISASSADFSVDELLQADSAASMMLESPLIVDIGKRERGARLTERMGDAEARGPKEPKYPKPPVMLDFQFFDRPAVERAVQEECDLLKDAYRQECKLFEITASIGDRAGTPEVSHMEHVKLVEQEKLKGIKEKLVHVAVKRQSLIRSAFPDWTRRDLRVFINACERNGRDAHAQIVHDVRAATGRHAEEITRYLKVFFSRLLELESGNQILDKLDKAEQRNAKRDVYNSSVRKKLGQYLRPEESLQFESMRRMGDSYNDAEDRQLFVAMGQCGFGMWEDILAQVSKFPLAQCDFFLTTRSASEVQSRCVKLLASLDRADQPATSSGATKKSNKSAAKSSGADSESSGLANGGSDTKPTSEPIKSEPNSKDEDANMTSSESQALPLSEYLDEAVPDKWFELPTDDESFEATESDSAGGAAQKRGSGSTARKPSAFKSAPLMDENGNRVAKRAAGDVPSFDPVVRIKRDRSIQRNSSTSGTTTPNQNTTSFGDVPFDGHGAFPGHGALAGHGALDGHSAFDVHSAFDGHSGIASNDSGIDSGSSYNSKESTLFHVESRVHSETSPGSGAVHSVTNSDISAA